MALGSWGTGLPKQKHQSYSIQVTNASRHWVLGEPLPPSSTSASQTSHKCLSALGSWGEYARVNYEC
jgi:hypothetical protein